MCAALPTLAGLTLVLLGFRTEYVCRSHTLRDSSGGHCGHARKHAFGSLTMDAALVQQRLDGPRTRTDRDACHPCNRALLVEQASQWLRKELATYVDATSAPPTTCNEHSCLTPDTWNKSNARRAARRAAVLCLREVVHCIDALLPPSADTRDARKLRRKVTYWTTQVECWAEHEGVSKSAQLHPASKRRVDSYLLGI